METIDVNPWAETEKSSYEIYRFQCSLPPIPTVAHLNGLTFLKTREKFGQEQRLLPEEYYSVFEEKSSGPIYLTPPIDIGTKCKAYFKSGSSQHMSTILEGISEIGVNFKDIQFLVASETLHKIAGSVFEQSRSWRLRAYSEIIEGRNVIIICDDDLDQIELMPLRDVRFVKEQRESINFAQSLCERYQGRNTNPYLHGSRVVISSLTHGKDTVNMVVVGEMDMAVDGQPVNAAVMTGRPNRVCLGDDEEEICNSFEYLWSRCFWIGITFCVIGMRSTPNEPVKAIHRFDVRDYSQKHRRRIGEHHDKATSCVALVMVCLRDQFQSGLKVNWIIEYEGRSENVEPSNIRIKVAEDSYSLWQVCEGHYTAKNLHKETQIERARRAMETSAPPEKTTSADLQPKEEIVENLAEEKPKVASQQQSHNKKPQKGRARGGMDAHSAPPEKMPVTSDHLQPKEEAPEKNETVRILVETNPKIASQKQPHNKRTPRGRARGAVETHSAPVAKIVNVEIPATSHDLQIKDEALEVNEIFGNLAEEKPKASSQQQSHSKNTQRGRAEGGMDAHSAPPAKIVNVEVPTTSADLQLKKEAPEVNEIVENLAEETPEEDSHSAPPEKVRNVEMPVTSDHLQPKEEAPEKNETVRIFVETNPKIASQRQSLNRRTPRVRARGGMGTRSPPPAKTANVEIPATSVDLQFKEEAPEKNETVRILVETNPKIASQQQPHNKKTPRGRARGAVETSAPPAKIVNREVPITPADLQPKKEAPEVNEIFENLAEETPEVASQQRWRNKRTPRGRARGGIGTRSPPPAETADVEIPATSDDLQPKKEIVEDLAKETLKVLIQQQLRKRNIEGLRAWRNHGTRSPPPAEPPNGKTSATSDDLQPKEETVVNQKEIVENFAEKKPKVASQKQSHNKRTPRGRARRARETHSASSAKTANVEIWSTSADLPTEEQSSDDDLDDWPMTWTQQPQEEKKAVTAEAPRQEEVPVPEAPQKTKAGIKRGAQKKNSQDSATIKETPKKTPRLTRAKAKEGA